MHIKSSTYLKTVLLTNVKNYYIFLVTDKCQKQLKIMVRPLKCRRVCNIPKNLFFGSKNSQTIIEMTIDEYETIRLIDLELLTQEECAVRMNVARTTVQAIYSSARKKIAKCLINNSCLKVHGGDYKVCEFAGKTCNKNCCKHKDLKGE